MERLGAFEHRDERFPEAETHIVAVEIATGHFLVAAPHIKNEADRKGTTDSRSRVEARRRRNADGTLS